MRAKHPRDILYVCMYMSLGDCIQVPLVLGKCSTIELYPQPTLGVCYLQGPWTQSPVGLGRLRDSENREL